MRPSAEPGRSAGMPCSGIRVGSTTPCHLTGPTPADAGVGWAAAGVDTVSVVGACGALVVVVVGAAAVGVDGAGAVGEDEGTGPHASSSAAPLPSAPAAARRTNRRRFII